MLLKKLATNIIVTAKVSIDISQNNKTYIAIPISGIIHSAVAKAARRLVMQMLIFLCL